MLGSRPLRIERLRSQIRAETMDVVGVFDVTRLDISVDDRSVSVSISIRGETGVIGVMV